MDILLKAIPIAIPVILVILIFLMGYVKAPPDVAYIISGLRKHPKVLIGKAGIKIPFLERVDKLIVRQISIDIKSEGYIPTQDFIGVDVDAVAKVRVMTDPEGIQLAMKNFLNMTEDDFNRAIVDSLQGNMREIIGTITLKEICNDRKKFGDEVQSKAQPDMNALGIQIITSNNQRVTDENSLINSLGQDNMSKIQKAAAIAKAVEIAKKNFFQVPMIVRTITHLVQGEKAAGVVLLRPASPGTGVIAGGPVRAVMECAGMLDVQTKSLGSANALNIVQATIAAL